MYIYVSIYIYNIVSLNVKRERNSEPSRRLKFHRI